jgi:hypothetical protein
MQASKPKAALALVSKAAPVSLGMRAASVASVVEVFVGFPSGPRNVPLADAERATMLGDVASCIKNGPASLPQRERRTRSSGALWMGKESATACA